MPPSQDFAILDTSYASPLAVEPEEADDAEGVGDTCCERSAPPRKPLAPTGLVLDDREGEETETECRAVSRRRLPVGLGEGDAERVESVEDEDVDVDAVREEASDEKRPPALGRAGAPVGDVRAAVGDTFDGSAGRGEGTGACAACISLCITASHFFFSVASSSSWRLSSVVFPAQETESAYSGREADCSTHPLASPCIFSLSLR